MLKPHEITAKLSTIKDMVRLSGMLVVAVVMIVGGAVYIRIERMCRWVGGLLSTNM
jgi:hypothetical protein